MIMTGAVMPAILALDLAAVVIALAFALDLIRERRRLAGPRLAEVGSDAGAMQSDE